MSFKKIDPPRGEPDPIHCTSPEHQPPGMIVLKPGIYEWTCPKCGRITTVVEKREHSFRSRTV